MANYTATMIKINNLLKVNNESSIYEVFAGTPKAGVKGVAGLRKRINNLPIWMAKAAKAAALEVGLEGFQAAMQRVPVATGQMAKSGKMYVGNDVLARGTHSGDDSTGVKVSDELYNKNPYAVTDEDLISLSKGTVNVYIEFDRVDHKGQNLAYWLHENLGEYGSGEHPQASKPGRGPKFVEGPMNEIIIPKLYDKIFSNVKYLVSRLETAEI